MSGNNINFYDLNKRDKIHSISGFESFYGNPGRKFCIANEELLLVCGSSFIFLVDCQAYQLISKIECKYICSLYQISNNFVLSGHDGYIKQWQCNGRDVKLYSYKNQIDSDRVFAIFKLNNTIISGSSEGVMKFWTVN